MDVECITENRIAETKPGPKSKYSTPEEKYKAQLEANRRYRQSQKGKLQKKKDDAKYISTERGRLTRAKAQAKHNKTEKGKNTYRRYWQSEKGRDLLRLYWSSQQGKSISRKNAAIRRALIRCQKIKDYFYDEIRKWYHDCPKGYEVDHIIPIKNDIICGLHVPWNFQYLTKTENGIKSNKFKHE